MSKHIVSFTLNGRPHDGIAPDNRLLLDYLRETLGLTGTKTACDGGECGACTVLIDNQPRLSCLTLVGQVEGRNVDTVEGLAARGLSPVQEGFHTKLGAQCGGCTPGFVMATEGLACGAIPIAQRRRHPRRARQQHLPLHRLCEDHRGGPLRRRKDAGESGMNEQIKPVRSIGKHVPMVDGPEKVSGRRASTPADFVDGRRARRTHLPQPLFAHAEIVSVDVSEAEKLPGVEGGRHRRRLRRHLRRACRSPIQRAPDGPRQGALQGRAGRRGRRRRRSDRAKEALPPHQDDGRGAAGLFPRPGRAWPTDAVDLHEHRPGNIERDVFFELGDVEDAFANADLVLERDYLLPRGLPGADGDARRGRRLRPGARPHDGARFDAGALLRPSSSSPACSTCRSRRSA